MKTKEQISSLNEQEIGNINYSLVQYKKILTEMETLLAETLTKNNLKTDSKIIHVNLNIIREHEELKNETLTVAQIFHLYDNWFDGFQELVTSNLENINKKSKKLVEHILKVQKICQSIGSVEFRA